MAHSIIQALGICLFAYIIRRLFFAKTSISNIPGPSRNSWWSGSFFQIFNSHAWKFHYDLIEKYGSVAKVNMILGDEQLFITDPLALHYITVKDQYIYEETDMFISTNKLVFGTSLLSTLGDHHRKQRKMLNPVFSLKHMLDVSSYVKFSHAKFVAMPKISDSPLNFALLLPRHLLPWVDNIGTPEFRRKVVDYIPWGHARSIQALEDGDDAVIQQVGKGKDIMSILLRANLEANEEDRLPEKELIGQMTTFIAAGQNTTAHAVSRVLHQLVLNPDVQTKLREEATAARKEHGDLDYDTLMALPYLDAVCRETLRVFPPLTMLSRTTRKDVVLPLMWPIKSADGKSEIKEIPLQKNTNVIMSILGANRSKRIWGEDAEEWKPERWMKPLPESVAAAHLPGIYSSMMTFHGGGRACIGFKFAEMGMKVMVSLLLETFEFSAGPEIIWTMSGLAAPVVKGSEKSPSQLPADAPVILYMGKDKHENEDLIKYAWPQDIWFHVDKLSSAHVYLRMPETITSWENIPEALLADSAQLVKANSIEVYVSKRENVIVNRLNKTKVEREVDHEQERADRLSKEQRENRAIAIAKKKEAEELAKQRAEEKAARDYSLLDQVENEDEDKDEEEEEEDAEEDTNKPKTAKTAKTAKTVQEMIDDFM
ncbi:hypothetical protein EW145_g2338 [Phellinidium pouzarii]|uniref:NFACT RNA-binding domain-containing protein n=1 Tax=Phellinidium pouzarii TaxID=167371 RepID=A0A4S4LB94_9AGAM|nr:hypothetical protein EW145_g2338 [Phellinidium pouzarii]